MRMYTHTHKVHTCKYIHKKHPTNPGIKKNHTPIKTIFNVKVKMTLGIISLLGKTMKAETCGEHKYMR